MKLNKNNFVQCLDKTAEKNPFLWLPCIILLAVILWISRLSEDIKSALTCHEGAVMTENYLIIALRRKFWGLRVIAMTLATIFLSVFIPISELNIYAANNSKWGIGYHWNDAVIFTIDTSVKYDGNYSIKIENTEYNDAAVEKVYNVEPNTQYKLTAMVKYDGYSINPDEYANFSGASIGISRSYDHSNYVTSNTWTKIEYCFNTGCRTEISLCLRNGMYSGTCKGTAWFSDIRLEKNITEPTNEWNVLAVVFKSVNAPVTKNGESHNYIQSLDDTDVEYLTGVLNNLYTSFDSISGGLMKVKKIDVVASDETLTSVSPLSGYGYNLDANDPQVSKILDYYLAQGCYNQIIAISPIRDIAENWAGLGGGKYNGINFCQINYRTRSPYPGNLTFFPDAIFVHEMLHCMESDSARINPEKTAVLHDSSSYGFTDGGDEWREWYTAYMRAELLGGKGLDPSVYQVYDNYQYILVSDDMSVDREIGGYN